MEKKGKTALILAAIAAVASGGIALSFDFSTTTSISGDTINTVMNQFGIDMEVDEFREICKATYDSLESDFKTACDILSRIP